MTVTHPRVALEGEGNVLAKMPSRNWAREALPLALDEDQAFAALWVEWAPTAAALTPVLLLPLIWLGLPIATVVRVLAPPIVALALALPLTLLLLTPSLLLTFPLLLPLASALADLPPVIRLSFDFEDPVIVLVVTDVNVTA